ncbi:hypothetical protein [Edaphobacter aggregans]|uniref:hypothetical protein n=1 Tax=Edaphobacter aggregans TaxID=570835 RepID=UPI00055112FD|nr:hypothetical protein [Edaphobacter aggregans]
MSFRRVFGIFLIVVGIVSLVHADEILNALKGSCRITASTQANRFELRLERGSCAGDRDCHESTVTEPADAFTGLSLSDLGRDGSHVDAVLRAEAGTLTCSGSVHESALVGEFTFEPNRGFVVRMGQLGITGFNSNNLEAYTLFRIDSGWVQSLQKEGIQGINSDNLIAMKIFNVEPTYVHSMTALGYPTPSAEKLIAMRVHKVDPAEVKQIRALGYEPTLDQLVEMRIFKVTPEFIERMQARGLNNLTISKLVQIRIFKLDE